MAAGYYVKCAVIRTWHFGDVGNKRHFIIVAISKLLGKWGANFQIPSGKYSDHTCYTARDIIENEVDEDRKRYCNDYPVPSRGTLPGSIQKVGQYDFGHGPPDCTSGCYSNDGQPPAATCLGGGRRVPSDWVTGDPIVESIMVSVDEVARSRGFGDDYVPYMRFYDDSDKFIFMILGNAQSQHFATALDEAIMKTLLDAGVSHDITGTVTTSKSKVVHTRRLPTVPVNQDLQADVVEMFAASYERTMDASIMMVFDTGAQAFFIHNAWNTFFKDGGRKSPAVIISAKTEANIQASKTGVFQWRTSGIGDNGTAYKQFIVTMPDGAVHSVADNQLQEQLAAGR